MAEEREILEDQSNRILEYLKEGNSVTPMDALRLFGCFRLSARIFDLKSSGSNIRTIMIMDKDTGKRFASYKLEV